MLYLQAPAGNTTTLPPRRATRGSSACGFGRLAAWDAHWFGSGTMALAAAVKRLVVNSGKPRPQVALAGYGCPDLVAAIRFAGAQPTFVDLEADSLCMNVDRLRATLAANDDLVAVIAVDLFGLPERCAEIRTITQPAALGLIQDCAQSVQPLDEFEAGLHGDAVVFSFGRGKPLCLLGGGALLLPKGDRVALQGELSSAGRSDRRFRPSLLRQRIRLYNGLISPRLYGVLALLAGSRLGSTQYVPLTGLEVASDAFGRFADAALEAHWRQHRDRLLEVEEAIAPLFADFAESLARLVPAPGGHLAAGNLNRYPLLIRDAGVRDRCIRSLRQAGISATRMYGRTLPEIVGMDAADSSPLPNATRLADQLLTLPVHQRLRPRDIGAMADALRRCLSAA